MIEDALWITIQVIEKYQKEHPDSYNHQKAQLDDLKEHIHLVLNSLESHTRNTA
jgi:hypothetical protein